MCDLCERPDLTADDVLERIREVMGCQRFAVLSVGGSRRTAEFSYTVGLTGQGLSELIVTGLRREMASRLVRLWGEYLLDQSVVLPGEVLESGPLLMQAVEVERPEEHLLVASRLYGDEVRGLQLVWADERGRWRRGIRGTGRGAPVSPCSGRGRPATARSTRRTGSTSRLTFDFRAAREDGRSSQTQCEHLRDRVRLVGLLVRPVPQHPREAQRDAARVPRRGLHAVEGDLDDELRPHVDDVRRPRHLTLQERRCLPAQQLVGEPLERLAEHDKTAVGIARTQVQVRQPSLPAAVPPLRGEDDQVQGVPRLHLQPAAAAASGLVRDVQGLDDHALVPARERVVRERPRLRCVVDQQPGRAPALGYDLVEQRHPVGEGLTEDVLTVDVQDVEEERGERHAAGPRRGPSRRHLERLRAAVLAECDRLAVQYDTVGGQRERGVDELRHARGHVVEAAGEHPHVRAEAVHLDADAVELPLHRRDRDAGERVVEVLRRLRQHRRQGTPDLEPEPAQPLRTGGQGGGGDVGQRAGQGDRRPDGRDRDTGRDGDGVGDDSRLGALPKLAAEQPDEQSLLRVGGCCEQLGDQPSALGGRALAGQGRDAVEGGVHVEDSQARRRGGRGQVAQRGVADPRSSLQQLTGQVRDDDRQLVVGGGTQRLDEQRDLRRPAGRGRDGSRRLSEVGEQHENILPLHGEESELPASRPRRVFVVGAEAVRDGGSHFVHLLRRRTAQFGVETALIGMTEHGGHTAGVAAVSGPRTASPVMVGREHEAEVLAELCTGLTPGAPAVALVGGRAGMGKTRLVAEATGRWQAQRCRVLLGLCTPVEGPPYMPLVAALRRALPADASVLRMLTGERRTSRTELFESLRAALDGLAAPDPLILVAEDLHWSDRATRDALTYLVAQSAGGRWAVVGTHRYDGPVSTSELGSFAEAMARRGPVIRIALEPLTVAQVAELAAAVTGVRPTRADAEALHRRTGGIPLLVEEVLVFGGSGVPDHLRSSFVARVVEHGDDVAQALEVVAVAGQCDELVISGVLGVDMPAIAFALKRARHADLVQVDAAGYRFRHEMLRETVYDDIPPGRRRELHRLVAAQLAARSDAEPAVLAQHWQLGGQTEQSALAVLMAAQQAEQMHAPATAHQHYERVLAVWHRLGEPVRQHCGPRDELLRRAAYAAERSGDFARAVDLTAERIASGEGTAADQALRWERLARYRWEAGDGHGSRAAYQEAVRVLPSDAGPTVRATVLSGLAWHLAATFEYKEARRLAADAMTACAEVDVQGVLWQSYLAQGIAWLGSSSGHAALEESCRLATAVGVGDRVALTRMWLNFSNQRLGYAGAREANLRIALRAAAADGLGASMEAALRYMLAEYLCETGRWDEAAQELELNLERLRVTGIPALFSWGYQSRLAAWRGDWAVADEALERVRSLTELAPQQPLPLTFAFAGRAGSLLWEGRLDEGLASARDAVTLGSVSMYDAAEPLAVLCRAQADVAERSRRDGRNLRSEVHEELSARVEVLKREPALRAAAFAATCEAELSRWSGERAEAPWRRAVERWQAAGDPYQEACARWRLAWALLADRSGRAEAAGHLASAAYTAARLGARPLDLAVDRLATRARLLVGPAGSRRVKPSPASSLTARELELLPLLAAGRSNAEIADILVISPRTVGIHVSRILHKLGAERRAQVSDLARRTGLLDE